MWQLITAAPVVAANRRARTDIPGRRHRGRVRLSDSTSATGRVLTGQTDQPHRITHSGSKAHQAGKTPPDRERLQLAAHLTERETDILRALAQGLSNAEIAAQLWLSPETVKTHVRSILGKLGVRDRTQAVVWAYPTGFVDPRHRRPERPQVSDRTGFQVASVVALERGGSST